MITGIIYKYTSPSGKIYIGQTLDENTRRQSFCNLNCSYGGDKIDNARHKYTPSKFSYSVLHRGEYENGTIAKKILNELESYYIRRFDSFNNGYNSTLGGDSLSGFTHTKDTKERMSKAHTGVPKSQEHKENIRETLSKIKLIKTQKFLDAIRRPISQYEKSGEFIMSYSSITEACTITGINGSNIGECCRGSRKSAGGYIWKFN